MSRMVTRLGWLLVAALLLGGCGRDESTMDMGGGASATAEPGQSSQPSQPDSVESQAADDTDFRESDLLVEANATAGSEVEAPRESVVTTVKFVGTVPGVDYYEDEKPRRKWLLKKYSDNTMVLHGLYEEFYEDGTKFCEGEYADGKRDGVWKFWHPNGLLAKEGIYRESQPKGKWVLYQEDGNVSVEENYRNGQADGRWLYYHDDGKTLIKQEEYHVGKIHGTWITWHKPDDDHEGELQKAIVANFKGGILHGERNRWYDNGQMASRENYREGKRHGMFSSWDAKGTPRGELKFEDGERK